MKGAEIEIGQDGRSDGRPLPLADVRVLAVEQFGAGPWGTLQIADLGAEVIKIEHPAAGGDVGRYVPPYQRGEDSLFFESFNRNKRSISLDLGHPAGRKAFHDLVRESDAVFCNLRGDGPASLGLTYDDLCEVNPRIVCCSLSGFGTTGPRAGEGAYDYMIQGLAGWMNLTGEPSGPPSKTGLSLVDYCGGYLAALAIAAGVHGARRDGVGTDCDLSLFETALSLLTYVGTWAATTDHEARRMPYSAHPSVVPFQLFRTADAWLVVACAKEKFWRLLCHAIERPDLLADARYADFAARDVHREELVAELQAVFLTRDTDGWLELLGAAGVPCGPVNDVRTALQDPQVLARDGVAGYEHPEFGQVRHVASPLRVGAAPARMRRAPRRGEDSADVLASVCGYSPEALRELEASGALGDVPLEPDDGAPPLQSATAGRP
jgi:crotonobetainyl-CoA:carnitine CoA-transferase CaiB-like acyl-CoA transferase